MSNDNGIEQCIQVGVEFVALGIVIHHILVGPRGSAVQLQGARQNPLQSLGTTEITLKSDTAYTW